MTIQDTLSPPGAPAEATTEAAAPAGEGAGREEGTGGARAALRAGRARVRERLVAPLQEAGLGRRRGQSAEAQAAMFDRLEGLLAYMSPAGLETLREAVREIAVGAVARPVWPEEVVIQSQARAIEVPPPSDSPKVVSYMRSAAGHAAAEGGWLVELYVWLKRNPGVPNGYVIGQIRAEAEENARARGRLRAMAEEGRGIAPAEREWLDWWHRQAARARGLMDVDADE